MRNIIVLTQFLNIGGLERLVCSLSAELRREGNWEPVVCYYDNLDGLPSLQDQLEKAGVQVCEFRKKQGVSLQLVRVLHRLAREREVQVIHTHDLGPLVYGVAVRVMSLFRIRIVHTQHSFAYSTKSWKYRLYENILARLANWVVCVSPEVRKRYLELGINTKRLVHIPNGVSFPNGPLLSREERLELRQELLSKHRSSQWILCLARIHSGKGQEHVLKIWNSLPGSVRKNCALIFVGPETTPGLLQILKEEAARLPDSERIHFVGGSLEPQKWIRASDLFVSASESEGMPLAALEAIGSGLPALLSDIPGHQIFVQSEIQAATFPLEQPEVGSAWIEAQVNEILREGKKYFQKAWSGSAPLRARYGIAKMAGKYSELYQGGR